MICVLKGVQHDVLAIAVQFQHGVHHDVERWPIQYLRAFALRGHRFLDEVCPRVHLVIVQQYLLPSEDYDVHIQPLSALHVALILFAIVAQGVFEYHDVIALHAQRDVLHDLLQGVKFQILPFL